MEEVLRTYAVQWEKFLNQRMELFFVGGGDSNCSGFLNHSVSVMQHNSTDVEQNSCTQYANK